MTAETVRKPDLKSDPHLNFHEFPNGLGFSLEIQDDLTDLKSARKIYYVYDPTNKNPELRNRLFGVVDADKKDFVEPKSSDVATMIELARENSPTNPHLTDFETYAERYLLKRFATSLNSRGSNGFIALGESQTDIADAHDRVFRKPLKLTS